MVTETERREVARMLRELPGDSTYLDLIGVIADRDGWYPAADAADRLADLIEPSCDRDALLALADEMDRDGKMQRERQKAGGHWFIDGLDVREYARRIREALGVQDA